MALEYKGGARSPGPLGSSQGVLGGRIPGPLDFQQVDLGNSQTATKAVKELPMPPPAAGSSTIIQARSIGWDLAKDTPSERDVKQGELANCPVAAILAALAHTAVGRKHIDSMITEYIHTQVKTTFSKEVLATLSAKMDDPDYKRPEKEILSKRYFSVNLGDPFEVSDVFYVKYSDGSDVDMIYMDSPKRALWPCVIEKAYAVKIGSYDDLDDDTKQTVNKFWDVLVGAKPDWLSINENTDLTKISAAAKAAGTIPTIAASREGATKVTSHHGYAVMGIQGSTIELYNPYAKIEKLSLQDFRSSFSDMFFGNPKG
jgi:Calpain family cysteine protease